MKQQRWGKEKCQTWNLAFLVLNFFCLTFNSFPAGAAPSVLGVVKTQDNANQWEGITTRLGLSGVAYCVVDLQQVRQAADLAGTQVLFLPNVETLSAVQVQAIQEWMRKGGRAIASGPLGTLSQANVRSQLRSLFGAYWGFGLQSPSTLAPAPANNQGWVQQNGLAGTAQGGVIIPAGLTSQTAAVWKSVENPPAVVTTDRSVFLGWRWGVDTASSPNLDSAWLRASLNRYGGVRKAQNSATDAPQQCPSPAGTTAAATRRPPTGQPSSTNPVSPGTAAGRTPATSPTQPGNTPIVFPPAPAAQVADANADGLVAPPGLDVKPSSLPITGGQTTVMRQELEALIGRFESAMLTANATNKVGTANGNNSSTQTKLIADTTSRSNQESALKTARTGLQKFLQLVVQQDYSAARQQWLQARRTLWDNYPIDRPQGQSEIRAMWLDRGTIVKAGSEQKLAKIFDRLAAAGFNTVFFETVNAGYPIYPSRVAQIQNPLVRGWDPLASAVKLAHERGMELHAWVWIFAVGNQRHNALVNRPKEYPGPVLDLHPTWAGYDNRGRLFHLGSGKTFLDPANPEVRRYLIQMLGEIATNYKIDGIQFDYIRYPFQDPRAGYAFGYGTAARQQFQQLHGVDPAKISPKDRNVWQKWTQFRTNAINTFVADASRSLRALKPNLILSAAVFPYPETERLQKLQQNWEVWAQRGDVDLLVPMTYALDTNKLQSLAQPLLTQALLGSTLVLPSIRLLNLPDAVAIDQIQALRDFPASGYALFAAENLNENLQGIFRRAQGRVIKSSTEPLPYRQPFQAAATRYAALQKEWDFLLETNQFGIKEPALSEWHKQSDALSNALNQLAANPSANNLTKAKISLQSFKFQFNQWMKREGIEQPYQVQVWDNRLATLERLLRFGERGVKN
ncbi:family 10 glycosylhydrolase [Coleofasciculus sp. FACHB-1120]|uniref:glycoside hydrolase family 10 protein n=1 Tax=Coleofasciculus sp. FACHB-1120 TaxID=2692783 RepID=UPI0018EF522A|nr:family 10 glycosylhydrolase [Coleofasciculus sp. FACHB-1120]MBD2742785.1 family 10 glycosylhydrolase [Coleofasciculus sp. FACHB-1120]